MTSAMAGALLPATSPAPLQGAGLNTFLQQLIVGITGLPGMMVRPAFQAEPPDAPDAGDAWAAFRTTSRPADAFPHIAHEDTPSGGQDVMRRHEVINVLVSFYDLGTNGLADFYAELLASGLRLPQNCETLGGGGMGLISVGEPTAVPLLLKMRWLYRVDLPFAVKREIVRVYPILNVLSATGSLITDTGVVETISTP